MTVFEKASKLLGKSTRYTEHYDPKLLLHLDRRNSREEIGIEDPLLFTGFDEWTGYELSWLNPGGKPIVAILTFRIPAESPFILESKSVKLYLNSFIQTVMPSLEVVEETITNDLKQATGAKPFVKIALLSEENFLTSQKPIGDCIDHLPIVADRYEVLPHVLTSDPQTKTEEFLYSHLFKTNCPVTQQPDWATLFIRYEGPKIDHASLLQYIVSYRAHQALHEQCIEQVFMDIHTYCKPEKLSIRALYTRRGGIDINPFRSNFEKEQPFTRTVRQ